MMANTLKQKLHETYSAQRYDNTDVWAGHLRVMIGDRTFPSILARVSADAGHTAVVEAELYVRDIDWSVSAAGIRARVWTDANDRGKLDARGAFHNASGRYVEMQPKTSADGSPVTSGNNLVLVSDPIPLDTPGVFHYSVSISADCDPALPQEACRWVSLNDIAYNQDGQIVVTHPIVNRCRSVSEVCIRKVGARKTADRFQSGKIGDLTERLDGIGEDVVYLLPFFLPGFEDLHTGEDVRKGTLGSVYAAKDFFSIDPTIVSPLETADLESLVRDDLIQAVDLEDLLDERQRQRVRTVDDLLAFDRWKELHEWVGTEALTQMVGRAEMRALVRKAHDLGKRVIFDLILMQTSRDNPLIREHPDWYVMDEDGQPAIHQIAWLVYSDVALLDLPFNKPLQNYLSSIAPFWIERCDFDGVRIDASQTVDRPFLKAIKNRIHNVKPDAIVLGETLCALSESRDIPVDLVYALFVDFHRDLNNASPLIDFVEETNASFAPGTVAMAYFENHDSVRATRVWRERYEDYLSEDEGLRTFWQDLTGAKRPATWMAQLKNLQASLVNATIGNGDGTRTIYGVEWGTTWGSEERTDFENPTLVNEDLRGTPPAVYLEQAYGALARLVRKSEVFADGDLVLRPLDIGDPDDRVLAYVRRLGTETVLVCHNLDHQWHRAATVDLTTIGLSESVAPEVVFDTLAFSIPPNGKDAVSAPPGSLRVALRPLQSLALRLR